MNLTQAILKEHSKAQTDKLVKWIGDDQKRFDELAALFLDAEPVVMQRAGWPLSYAAENHPGLVKKHIDKFVKSLAKPTLQEAVKRNIIRIFQFTDIPERHHGVVMDQCFQFITDPKEKPAVKAFALTVLENLAKKYPEIKPELKLVIQERWDTETAAFHSRARKILKFL